MNEHNNQDVMTKKAEWATNYTATENGYKWWKDSKKVEGKPWPPLKQKRKRNK